MLHLQIISCLHRIKPAQPTLGMHPSPALCRTWLLLQNPQSHCIAYLEKSMVDAALLVSMKTQQTQPHT